jgi:hypothetical protein
MSPHYDEAFVRRMIESTRGQLACLQAHLSPRSNWRISHLNCLLYCGVVVPGLEEYVPFAVRHLNETFHRQIHDDGSHEEHTPGYHGWMCRLFTMLWRLARARPELGLRIATDRMVRMWDYTVYSTAPDGGSAGLHDSGAWSQGPGRIGAIAERDAILQEAGMNGRAEWDITKRPSRHFPDAGQVFLRDDWSPDATFIAFDATRWGGGHCHLSRLAVSLYAGTRMLLYDPGIFSYEMSDPYAPYGKATRSHNTIHLGGMNQTEVDPDTRKVHLEDDLAVVASCYGGGYFPGEYTWSWPTGKGAGVYGVHDRVLLWLRGRGVLVFDHIRTDGNGQPFAAHWQFPAGPAMLDTAQRCAWTSGARDNILVRCIDSSIPLDLRIHEGEKDPILGWLPDAHPHYRPAPLIAMGGRAQSLGTTMVTLLYPFRDDRPPEIGIERFERCTGQPYGFRFTWPDGTEDLVACSSRLSAQVNQAGPVESDGTLAVITLRGGEPSRAFLLDGMFLRFQDRDLIRRDAAGTWRVHFSA